ncbi:baculoviral IAP repeat-containing protein 7-B-like [Ruditapes philippinarum]|uniref:baculoviral IAP repeat-containing protein 7-B-like n=1 Tax=Ruditapes philippinarum TaxID=129788 RepID=UPI00295A59CF|nr:baculoviral IAP repeat-containing protein 7-B-like [Ruditapes philippinarum]XP_060606913.1 baculoviral IAP repeat-containing protein 7-B-like [Ruditapes philippinarum]XP_060606915.1 baculoviral IAP repeat-containing protein 7-B-like [Ruditapes philippinarum]XP_060606916.1 baculoviral IAP repeat-containing protein 7-B-like [Ruditapes philippinarum]XP_060606917.1 baculoviral IAP repeat-containing protein 7-B-like [Ruditapes philippinarum]XP_060606918.1 baculoviral IAP repeat-containing protei
MAMSKFDGRLASLQNWPKRNLFDLVGLARGGLYFLGPNDDAYDRLRCAFCEFIVANLKEGDDLLTMHASFVPMCWKILTYKGKEFVQSVLQEEEANLDVQFFSKCPDDGMYASRLRSKDLTVLGIAGRLLKDEQSSSTSTGSRQRHVTERGVLFTVPEHLNMMDPHKRMASFANMNILYKTLLSLDDVVQAGFFFTGAGDSVRCYYCGAGFKNWKRSDDPWVVHARHAPHCMHVILTKGEEFVEKKLADRNGNREVNPTFLPAENAGNRKRPREPEQEREEMTKVLRVGGINDREGTDRSRSENTIAFPSPVSRQQGQSYQARGRGQSVGQVECDRCQMLGHISAGFVSVNDRTYRCESCCKRFQD